VPWVFRRSPIRHNSFCASNSDRCISKVTRSLGKCSVEYFGALEITTTLNRKLTPAKIPRSRFYTVHTDDDDANSTTSSCLLAGGGGDTAAFEGVFRLKSWSTMCGNNEILAEERGSHQRSSGPRTKHWSVDNLLRLHNSYLVSERGSAVFLSRRCVYAKSAYRTLASHRL